MYLLPSTRVALVASFAITCLVLPPALALVVAGAGFGLAACLRHRPSALPLALAFRVLLLGGGFLLVIKGITAVQDGGASCSEVAQSWMPTFSLYCTIVASMVVGTRVLGRNEVFRVLLAARVSPLLAFGVLQAAWLVPRILVRGQEVLEAQSFRTTGMFTLRGRILAYAYILPPVVSSLAVEQVEKAALLTSRGIFASGARTQAFGGRRGRADSLALVAAAIAPPIATSVAMAW